jgi:hypothetical protein
MSFISSNMKRVKRDVIVNGKSAIRPCRVITYSVSVFLVILALVAPERASAYIDPGTTGMVSQILYVLFYGALGLFFYFLRSIKQYLTNTKHFLARFLG